MGKLQLSGLYDAAKEIHCGVNCGDDSKKMAHSLFPKKCNLSFHGADNYNDNLTIGLLEQFLTYPQEWNILYFHSKGATLLPGDSIRDPLLKCMMLHTVERWRQCVKALEIGYDSAGCHWLCEHGSPMSQCIWAGNFWWATSSFLRTLPSIYSSGRAHHSGIRSPESRFEAELWIGNGIRKPRVLDFHPHWDPTSIRQSCPHL